MFKDFKTFILRGNVMDLAIAVVIGAAFARIISSLVDDVLMPPLGLLFGKADFTNRYLLLQEGLSSPAPYASLAEAKTAGAVTLNYGLFFNSVLAFLILAAAVFLLVRAMMRMSRKPAPLAPNTKECPYCISAIPLTATRCAHCTSQLSASGVSAGAPPASPPR